MSAGLASCLFEGTLMHARLAQRHHSFKYNVYMTYMELLSDPVPLLQRFWLWSSDDRRRGFFPPVLARWSPRDYLSKAGVHKLLHERIGSTLSDQVHRVFVLANCRCFGFIFNSISIYYCFSASDSLIAAILEVHNTPWGEVVHYCLDFRDQPAAEVVTTRFAKEMHVSPFFGMDYTYSLRLGRPGERLLVDLSLEKIGPEKEVALTARLDLRWRPLTQRNLLWLLLRYPFMTFSVMLAIYWQALKLWLKGVTFFSHPGPTLALPSRPDKEIP